MTNLIQPRTLSGFRDYPPKLMIPREHLLAQARRVYCSYGFAPIDTPALEFAEIVLGKGGEAYLHTGQPVASRAIAADPGLDCGPSTVRNELAILEEHGLLSHPHVSAGRVPTDAAHLLFLAPCDPEFCNGEEGWMTDLSGGNRRPVADQYRCAEGDLCLENVVNAPAGGWVDAATFADVDTGFIETCFQGAHFVKGVVVDNAPQFCLSRPAYDFDIRAA